MPQFTSRRTQPLRADSYRRLARLLRNLADKIEAAAERADPRQRKSLTDAIDGAYRLTLHHWHKHHGRNPVVEAREAQEARRALDRARGL